MGYFRERIDKMAGYTPGFQPKQTDVVKLNTNENPYPPSPAVLSVRRPRPSSFVGIRSVRRCVSSGCGRGAGRAAGEYHLYQRRR